MAESSYWAFYYVVLVGMFLTITLFVIQKYSPRERHIKKMKSILNKPNELCNELTFAKSHLLQANATVIAGLFIFLTIQGDMVVAGIPALIDTAVDMKEIQKYDEIRKDDSRDQVVRDEAIKRYAESTLDLEEKYIRLSSAYDFKNVQYFFNPIVIFSTALVPFSLSCIFTISSRDEQDWIFTICKILTIFGFFLMFAGAIMFIGFPILPKS